MTGRLFLDASMAGSLPA